MPRILRTNASRVLKDTILCINSCVFRHATRREEQVAISLWPGAGTSVRRGMPLGLANAPRSSTNTLNNTIILSEVVIILIISYIVTRRALCLSQTSIGVSLACLIIKIVTFTNFRLTALLVFLSRAKTLTNALGKLQIRTYIFDTLSRSAGPRFPFGNRYTVTLIKFNTSCVKFG